MQFSCRTSSGQLASQAAVFGDDGGIASTEHAQGSGIIAYKMRIFGVVAFF
jgi:hypothetical protein